MFKNFKSIYKIISKIIYKWDSFLEEMFGMGSNNKNRK